MTDGVEWPATGRPRGKHAGVGVASACSGNYKQAITGSLAGRRAFPSFAPLDATWLRELASPSSILRAAGSPLPAHPTRSSAHIPFSRRRLLMRLLSVSAALLTASHVAIANAQSINPLGEQEQRHRAQEQAIERERAINAPAVRQTTGARARRHTTRAAAVRTEHRRRLVRQRRRCPATAWW